jgi:hypothetical protein
MGPADPMGVRELENPLRPWVDRLVHGVPEAGNLSSDRVDLSGDLQRRPTRRTCLLEQPRALLRCAEDDRTCAENPRRNGSLQRSRVGGERHPRGDVGGHHPVLGDRDQQQVEEVALLLGRLLPREEQVEVLGEAQAPHQVAGEVAPPHLDPVWIGLADVADVVHVAILPPR